MRIPHDLLFPLCFSGFVFIYIKCEVLLQVQLPVINISKINPFYSTYYLLEGEITGAGSYTRGGRNSYLAAGARANRSRDLGYRINGE